jgi:hypothetical protein
VQPTPARPENPNADMESDPETAAAGAGARVLQISVTPATGKTHGLMIRYR